MPMSTKAVEKVLRDSSFEIYIDFGFSDFLNIGGGDIALDSNYGMCHSAAAACCRSAKDMYYY